MCLDTFSLAIGNFINNPYLSANVINPYLPLMANFALLIFLRSELINSRDSWNMRTIFIIFIAAAVVSHFLSVVGLLITLFLISMLILIYKGHLDRKFLLVFVLLATWQVYIAGSYALDQITGSVHTAFSLESTLSATKNAAFSGSQPHTQIIYVKIISIFMLSLLAFIGLFYEIIWKRKFTLKNLTLPVWISANFSITFLTSYGGEILSRTFAASSTILYILGAKIINNNKLSLILLIVLLISPPLSIINAYGNEAIDYVSPIEIAGTNFLFDHHAENSLVKSLGQRAWNIRSYNDFENWGYDPQNMTPEDLTPLNERGVRNQFYILIGQMDMNTYVYTNGPTNFTYLKELDVSTQHNKIYDSPGFTLYQIGGIK